MVHNVGHSVALNFVRHPTEPKLMSSSALHKPNDGHGHGGQSNETERSTDTQSETRKPGSTGSETISAGPRDPTESERQKIAELKTRDRQVRAHELAHKVAAGSYGGPVSYEYQAGPDGQRYAVGGEVAIDASAVSGDPEATIQKMQVIARAALAPAQPSAQDRSVAVQAQQAAANARRELLAERLQNQQTPNDQNDGDREIATQREGYGDVPAVGHGIDKTV